MYSIAGKISFIFLFMFTLLLSINADDKISTIVSKQNLLYDYEIAGKSAPLTEKNHTTAFKVDPSNSIGENFKNLTIIKRIFINDSSPENMSYYVSQAKFAHSIYKGNAAIACFYSYALITFDPSQTTEALSILIPYIQESDNTPGICRTIWAILNIYITNKDLISSSNNPFFELPVLFETNDSGLIIQRLKLLSSYWGSKIDPNYSTLWNVARIEESKEQLQKQGGHEEAIALWNKIVCNSFCNKKTIIEKNSKTNSNNEAIKDNSNDFNKVDQFLNVFTELPNDLQKIELTLNKITKFRRQLKQYPDIPNYEDLKKSIGDYEAQVINIAYKAYILREYKWCLKSISSLAKEQSEKDSRVLAVKIYCMQKEKFPTQQIIATIDQLLKIEPKNPRAFMLKRC